MFNLLPHYTDMSVLSYLPPMSYLFSLRGEPSAYIAVDLEAGDQPTKDTDNGKLSDYILITE